MSKKNFKGGLGSLLSSTGLVEKKEEVKKEKENKNAEKKELSDDEKHWLLIKIDRLNQELLFWRTGKIDVETFHETLKQHNLTYNSENNEIQEL